ncbi:ABC transporter permease [Roseiterribacter gracilis]|uniref:Peptide ABC transporter permease n=1 Tax=Roseiterribacter gracilis TaxID=2812848 RepID=A0A8S8XCY8_9PROT|nr:peptide ABC transporter permease [Rhodospirillales bacterium TMPK1]
MLRHVLFRLAGSLPTLLLVSLLVFCLLRLMSGDPAALLVGDLASAEELQRVRAQLGLDQPLPLQYLAWLNTVLHGNLGVSLMTDQPVLPTLLHRFGVTAQIVLPAFVIAAMLAVPAGILAARLQGRAADSAIVLLATLTISMPSFWIGMLLILLFGVELGWLPTMGFAPISNGFTVWAEHAVMPITTLALIETAILVRLIRASAIEVLRQDYVDYARAKGLGERTILLRHVLRNVLSPTVTMLGLILGSLLSGTTVTETLFGIPGLGSFLVEAIYARDYPTIQGTLLFVILLYTAINLAIDLLYPLIDPRVRLR